MKKLLLFALLLCAAALPAQIVATIPLGQSHPASQSYADGRYEIVQSPIAHNHIFRLDKYTGQVWKYVRDGSSHVWQLIPFLTPNPDTDNETAHYQISCGAMDIEDIFLLNVRTGQTWQLVDKLGRPAIWQPIGVDE